MLEPDLVIETNDLAVESILGLLDEGERSKAARADATGARNIRLAQDLRKQLKERTARRRILFRDAAEIAAGDAPELPSRHQREARPAALDHEAGRVAGVPPISGRGTFAQRNVPGRS